MPNTLRLKRSAVAGRVPTLADLLLGELALNTHDGKLYTRRDNGTASVVEIGGGAGGVFAETGQSGGSYWTRFENGLQILVYNDPSTRATTTGSGSLWASAAFSHTFAKAFVGNVDVKFSSRDSVNAPCWATGSWSNTGVSAVFVISVSSIASAKLSYTAVGRWK
jgi:hypothetical protein